MRSDDVTALMAKIDKERVPRHVAIIMDGNGRWAKRQGLSRSAGHYKGVDSVRDITRFASDLGIGYLTLYAFSTENWSRPQDEVDTLMHLIGYAIENETPELMRNNVRLHLIGDIDGLPEGARCRLTASRDKLAKCTGLNLMLCLNYSARWELTRAAREIARSVADGTLSPDAVNDSDIIKHLATWPAPDPDLLIRTGGETRVSNFLLWQISYAELVFTDTLWPDFREKEFCDAIIQYMSRERRFGKTSKQVNKQSNKIFPNHDI